MAEWTKVHSASELRDGLTIRCHEAISRANPNERTLTTILIREIPGPGLHHYCEGPHWSSAHSQLCLRGFLATGNLYKLDFSQDLTLEQEHTDGSKKITT